MDLHELVLQMGIPSYRTNIQTQIPTTPTQKIEINKQMPEQVGRIYGLSIVTDGVTPDNNTLITQAEAQSIYLTLKYGATDFFEQVRLDELIFFNSGFPTARFLPYMPVNLPWDMSFDKSFYENPTLIASPGGASPPKVIMLQWWYISRNSYKNLEDCGLVGKNGIPGRYILEMKKNAAEKK